MNEVHFDSAALRSILKSAEVRAMVEKAAREVADHAERQNVEVGAFRGGSGRIPLPVVVKTETTDRATASVVLAHPAGIAAQAKYGVLTRAASAAGFRVIG